MAQHDQHGGAPPDDIGAAHVKFENSCAAAVKPDFNKGVALLHSFWFPQATAMFDSILTRDATCAMAYWGKALASWGNPFGGIKNQKVVEMTKLSIDKAKATGSPSSPTIRNSSSGLISRATRAGLSRPCARPSS